MTMTRLSDEFLASPIAVGESISLPAPGSRRFLVLKLDHLGDFIIGMPAMRALRDAFPRDHITLICGSWNLGVARSSGLADEVRGYDWFDEQGWRGHPAQDLAAFDAAVAGGFDVAIDLRVDDDTRGLLERVPAKVRCGIGARSRYPYLDIALPAQPKFKDQDPAEVAGVIDIPAERFITRLQHTPAILQSSRGRLAKGHIVYGPYAKLSPGRYRATFALRARGAVALPRLTVEVARDRETLTSAVAAGQDLDGRSPGPSLTFESEGDSEDNDRGRFEFRVHSAGSAFAFLQFAGVRIERLGDLRPLARFRPVDVHIGEQFSLLVELIRQRLAFAPPDLAPGGGDRPAVAERIAGLPPGPRVMLAPLSNKLLRDWPLPSYVQLTGLLLRQPDVQVVLLGSKAQAQTLGEIAAAHGADPRIINLGGQTSWLDLSHMLGLADLVICNNSGIAHLAAALGAPTLAIYAAAHQPPEWGPRGARVRTLMAQTPCSPCGFDILSECRHEHICMKLITPQTVFEHALAMLGRDLA
jgi:ADP-heptose:LPS heptosyltransferase